MNNVVPTLLFSVGSVVKQRDPLSSYLFILALQTLLTTVKQNQDIKGIVVEDKEIKCIPFASDLTNLLCDKESSDSLSSLLNTYGECSGLKLDQDKKESYWIGSFDQNHDVLDMNKPIKILGILDHVYFAHASTDISVDISTDSRPMYQSTYRSSIGRYGDRHIGRESVDMSTEMCRSTYRPTHRSSIGRYVDRHSTDMSADTSTECDCPIAGRHVDR